jgi:UDP-GlcNAc:undecaprenyl-phosphate/decaprenyl-phosphate GlcNAc-1-phosphate transferase
MTLILLLPLFLSFFIGFLLIQMTSKVDWAACEDDLHGVQKFHTNRTSRLGGISIFTAFSVALWSLSEQSNLLMIFWLASLPVFFTGVVEDLILRVSPIRRLISAFTSILIVYIWMGVGITELGFEWTDYLLSNYKIISILLTLLVVGGAVNSFNIIDGFNGLLSGYAILASLSIAYIAYILGDEIILQLSLILATSVFGFFALNFPFGKIFMGDGGAYFVGFMLAVIGLMLVDRHEELSNWFVLLIFIYPMYELLYSIYRRKIIHKVDASQPDANHLHSLIYRKLISCDRFKHDKVICNSMVSPFMWLLSLVGIIPAVIWFDNQTMLIISAFMFMFIYAIIYKYISSDRFKFNH